MFIGYSSNYMQDRSVLTGAIMFACLLLIVSSQVVAQAPSNGMMVTGYFANHSINTMGPDDVDYSALTHIIHFATGVDSTPPFLQTLVSSRDSAEYETANTWRNVQRELLDSAHRHGIKVMLSIANVNTYGGNNAIMSYITSDSARCQIFADATLAYARRKGYDGVDFNWEWPRSSDEPGYTRMMRMFRRGLDQWPTRGWLTHALYPTAGFGTGATIRGAYNIPLLNQYMDQHNVELYGLQAGQTNLHLGYTCALAKGTVEAPGGVYDAITLADSQHPNGQNIGPLGLARGGWDKKKIGVGLGFLYWHITSPSPLLIGGSNTGNWQNWTRNNYGDVIGSAFGSYPEYWDDKAKVHYKKWQDAWGYHYLTYEDSLSLSIKATWAKENGFNLMIYELGTGYITSNPGLPWSIPNYQGVRDPLLQAIKHAVGLNGPAPPVPKSRGEIFFDRNQNRLKDIGEESMSGWTVTLSGAQSMSMLSDSAGEYEFSPLPEGTYTVSVVPKAFWNQTFPVSPSTYSFVMPDDSVAIGNFGMYASNVVGYTVDRLWNTVSLPVRTPENHASEVFTFATSPIYRYADGYLPVEYLDNGPAYWVKFGVDHTIWSAGTTIVADTLTLVPGWNFVGSVTNPVPVENLITEPAGIIASFVYGYNRGNYVTEVLQPGKGYWVQALQPGKLIISSVPLAIPRGGRATRLSALDDFSVIEFETATGELQKIYFRVGAPTSSLSMELPPKPPAGAFDVRFSSIDQSSNGRIGEIIPESETPVRMELAMQSASYPLKIRWNNRESSRKIVLIAGRESIPLIGEGERLMQNNSDGSTQSEDKLVLFASNGHDFPDRFELAQNFPNPFNNETIIPFSLATNAQVGIDIFNLLGERVVHIEEKEFPQGAHMFPLEAAALASGVYFYRLTARYQGGIFTKVNRMVLLR